MVVMELAMALPLMAMEMLTVMEMHTALMELDMETLMARMVLVTVPQGTELLGMVPLDTVPDMELPDTAPLDTDRATEAMVATAAMETDMTAMAPATAQATAQPAMAVPPMDQATVQVTDQLVTDLDMADQATALATDLAMDLATDLATVAMAAMVTEKFYPDR